MKTMSFNMEDEDFDKMVLSTKAYIAAPLVKLPDGTYPLDNDGQPTGELVDDLTYVRGLLVGYMNRCVIRAHRSLAELLRWQLWTVIR